jgi:hypothetical protein
VTHAEILAEVEARGIETLRLSFADQHGILRGKTLTPRALKGALEGGVAMTSTLLLKDTSHRTVFPVWGAGSGLGEGRLDGAGDVLMIPDAVHLPRAAAVAAFGLDAVRSGLQGRHAPALLSAWHAQAGGVGAGSGGPADARRAGGGVPHPPGHGAEPRHDDGGMPGRRPRPRR